MSQMAMAKPAVDGIKSMMGRGKELKKEMGEIAMRRKELIKRIHSGEH